MTFSLHSMIRMIVLMAVGSTILAVGVSRLIPPQQVHRQLLPVCNFNVNDYLLGVVDRQPRWINSETGEMKLIPVEVDGIFEAASCSPWVDDSGQRQVVGRWSSRQNHGTEAISTAFGLGRYSFPEGKLIDQISCETVPTSAPCWYPGTRARILFAAGDGDLHQFSFEDEDRSEISSEPTICVDSEPSTLIWACPKPGLGNVFIGEINWPTDPSWEGKLIASMRILVADETGMSKFSSSELWWMKLDLSGTRIIELGPLINHDVSTSRLNAFDERSPVVSKMPDGTIVLAYAQQSDQEKGWAVYLAKILKDERGNLIPANESKSYRFPVVCQPSSPNFSVDGRWLSILTRDEFGIDSVLRLPTLTASETIASLSGNLSERETSSIH